MLKIQNGTCAVDIRDNQPVRLVRGVLYSGRQVYIWSENVIVGKYLSAYIVCDGKGVVNFGKIKFTKGTIIKNKYEGNYILCEY